MISKYRMLESPYGTDRGRFQSLGIPLPRPTSPAQPHLAADVDHVGVRVIKGQQSPVARVQLLQGHGFLEVFLVRGVESSQARPDPPSHLTVPTFYQDCPSQPHMPAGVAPTKLVGSRPPLNLWPHGVPRRALLAPLCSQSPTFPAYSRPFD